MKIIYTCLLLGSVLFACSDASNRTAGDSIHSSQKEKIMSVTQENKTTVRRLYEEGLNKRNYALLNELVGESYTGPRGEKGAAGITAIIKPLIEAFPDIQWSVDDLVGEADKVTVRWSWEGTHKGTFRGYPATEKHITNQAIAIYQLENGKIVHAWLQSDQLGFLQQIGVVPTDLSVQTKK